MKLQISEHISSNSYISNHAFRLAFKVTRLQWGPKITDWGPRIYTCVWANSELILPSQKLLLFQRIFVFLFLLFSFCWVHIWILNLQNIEKQIHKLATNYLLFKVVTGTGFCKELTYYGLTIIHCTFLWITIFEQQSKM